MENLIDTSKCTSCNGDIDESDRIIHDQGYPWHDYCRRYWIISKMRNKTT